MTNASPLTAPAETVDAEAKDSAKQLAKLAARKAVKKVAKPAAPTAAEPKPARRRQPRRQRKYAIECVQRCCAGAHSRAKNGGSQVAFRPKSIM
jgi:hypothetical protein